MGKFKKAFRELDDPRAANATHDLLEILFIALAAVLCGAEGPSDMAEFGRSKEQLLRGILRLENGIPSHDTFGRVFRMLDPRSFAISFRRFMVAFASFNHIDLTGVIAIDGKALRGAYERGRSATPLHMVNVFAAEARMALASIKAPGRNEALGALEVLQILHLKHCIITADALHCHRKFAASVLERGGQYVLALKENQSKLYAAVAACFARAGTRSSVERLEPSTHDRREWRRATVMRNTSLAAHPRLSRGCRGGAHHLASTAAWYPRREALRALLSALQIHPGQEVAGNRAQSLGDREPAALGAQARRLGRFLPAWAAWPYAIALPFRGRYFTARCRSRRRGRRISRSADD
jgi:predicted transposase YbfD/YdcC